MSTKRFTFPDTVPLRYDHGNVRVTGSRVTLQTLVIRFQVGDTLEEIHEGFPSVTPEQIKTIIDWYLDNRFEVDEYIREIEVKAAKLRQEFESRPEGIAFREKMRSFREERNKR